MLLHTHLLTWLTFAPWVARKSAAASLPARAALCMRQFSARKKMEKDEDENVFKGLKALWQQNRLLNSTCGCVWCIRVASSLDKLGCKTILIKWGAVHNWCVILKWVYWGVWRHGDVLQGQPQSCAALVVLELQVKPNRMDRLHQVTHRIISRVEWWLGSHDLVNIGAFKPGRENIFENSFKFKNCHVQW